MQPLNPELYKALVVMFQDVKIEKKGKALTGTYEPGAGGKLRLIPTESGEYYIVRCPYCADKSGHLYINHRWGVRDPVNRTRNLWLASCFRNNCMSQWINRDALAVTLEGYTIRARAGTVTVANVVHGEVSLSQVELPEDFQLLSALADDEEARIYAESRGFSPEELSKLWGVGLSYIAYRETYGRLVIPLRGLLREFNNPAELVGDSGAWQVVGYMGRLLTEPGPGDAKYLTSKGTPKSRLLYGLDQVPAAGSAPIIVCEGPSDVWRVGPGAVGLFGKTISETQCKLLRKFAGGREIVVLLDPEAQQEAIAVAERLRRALELDLSSTSAPGRVVVAQLPDERDPGDCTPAEIQCAVQTALGPRVVGKGKNRFAAKSPNPSANGKRPGEDKAATHLLRRSSAFAVWKPSVGSVFAKPFAFAVATKPIDPERPWLTPGCILAATFDGKRGFFLLPKHIPAFLKAHKDRALVVHDAAFALAVVAQLERKLTIYKWVDENRVWDTQLLHRLLVLGQDGVRSDKPDESSLRRCSELYLDTGLPVGVRDPVGDEVLVSFDKWHGRSIADIEPVYLDCLATDAIATHKVYMALRSRLKRLLDESHGSWGFVSKKWLGDRVREFGPQTHHIQLRATIVLREITANGLHVDLKRQEALISMWEARMARLRRDLEQYGPVLGAVGADPVLQKAFARLERENPDERFPRESAGQYATSREALQDLVDSVPFVRSLLEYRATAPLLTALKGRRHDQILHPSFDVLATTGRTSSYGEINAQAISKDERVRACFVTSPGHVFIDEDYASIEMCTLAQACNMQFGLASALADALNAGRDVHAMVAAKMLQKTESLVTPSEREKAKVPNFGLPVGMTPPGLQKFARTEFGLRLSLAEAQELSAAWFALFPEMKEFLFDTTDNRLEIAKLFDLTAASHFAHTKDDRFIKHIEDTEDQHRPSSILGGMCLRAIKSVCPKKDNGDAYSREDLDYFWSRLTANQSVLPPAAKNAVLARKPSAALQQHVMALVGNAGVFTYSGRLRAAADSRARHNCVFQGLAADGAKLALWDLWRAGYRIVNFVHDQVLVEVPAGSDLKKHAERIRAIMIAAMKQVVPDVAINVNFAACDRWYKKAKAVFDKAGKRLLLWQPPQESGAKAKSHSPQRRPVLDDRAGPSAG